MIWNGKMGFRFTVFLLGAKLFLLRGDALTSNNVSIKEEEYIPKGELLTIPPCFFL
jgi:hypothetical protein